MLQKVFGFLLGCFGLSVVVGSLWVFFFLFLLSFLPFFIFESFCILHVCSSKDFSAYLSKKFQPKDL
jgi:hypothetical protein